MTSSHNAAVLATPTDGFATHCPLVIAGGGACGLVAALAAHDAGAEVIVLEAATRCHGSSGMSLGALCAAGTAQQRQHNVDDDAASFFADIMAKTNDQADVVLARLAAEQSGPALDWLAERHEVAFNLDLGWKPAFGHTRRRLHTSPGMSGRDMMSQLEAACDRAGIMVVTRARVVGVYATADRVTGVRVQRPDGHVEVIGCDALFLATCGFGGNPAMIAEHLPAMAGARYFGWEDNRGDAVLWGTALGAMTADMSAYQGLGLLAEPYGIDVSPKLLIEGGVQVNARGERFNHELADVSGQGAVVIAQPGGFAWVIYDARIDALCAGLPQYRDLLALGAMRVGNDVRELAYMTGLPYDALTATLAKVAVANGVPDKFGRRFDGPPLTAPFHALKVTGALFHTQGGLVVDRTARVSTPSGEPLPNLFAGGGAARSICGPSASGYLPGAGLCMAVTLGYVGGAAAGSFVSDIASRTDYTPELSSRPEAAAAAG